MCKEDSDQETLEKYHAPMHREGGVLPGPSRGCCVCRSSALNDGLDAIGGDIYRWRRCHIAVSIVVYKEAMTSTDNDVKGLMIVKGLVVQDPDEPNYLLQVPAGMRHHETKISSYSYANEL